MAIKCRLCGIAGHEAVGVVLQRMNEKGVEGIWECRPTCGAGLSLSETLPAAIDGLYDEPSLARKAATEIDNLLSTRLSATAYLTEVPSIQELAAVIESCCTHAHVILGPPRKCAYCGIKLPVKEHSPNEIPH